MRLAKGSKFLSWCGGSCPLATRREAIAVSTVLRGVTPKWRPRTRLTSLRRLPHSPSVGMNQPLTTVGIAGVAGDLAVHCFAGTAVDIDRGW